MARIWHERYMGFTSDEVRSIAASRACSLYVLTDCDIPFVQDGLRDGEHIREWMTGRFREVLQSSGRPWISVSGTHENRMRAVVAALESLITNH